MPSAAACETPMPMPTPRAPMHAKVMIYRKWKVSLVRASTSSMPREKAITNLWAHRAATEE